MPRPALPPRLYLEPARRDRKTGRVTHEAAWVITYRDAKRRTGCGETDLEGAARALAEYVAELHADETKEPEKNRTASAVSVADVLSYYAEHRAIEGGVARPKELISRIDKLIEFWGDKSLADVTKRSCAAYAKARSTPAAARRELEDLQAAITMAIREGHCRETVIVTLPPKPASRVDYFTRDQVAALVRYCWTFRETQIVHRGPRKGQPVLTRKRPLRHLVPFILTALYTASRSSRIWKASFEKEPGRPWIDLENGIFHRMHEGEIATNKRAGTIQIPPRLLRHMRAWHAGPMMKGVRQPRRYLVEYRGRPSDPKQALARVMDEVFGPDHPYVRHTFRHTAVTWLMWSGESIADIAEYASMTERILRSVYSHHHPDSHRSVGAAFSSGRAGKRRAA